MKGTIYMRRVVFIYASGTQFLNLCVEREIKFIRKKLIDKLCESDIKDVVEEMSHPKIYETHSGIVVDDDVCVRVRLFLLP